MGTKSAYRNNNEESILAAVFKVIKSLFVSLIITFASIIIFAFIIKWAQLEDSIITPVNLVIKALSVLLGVIILNRKSSRKLLNGALFGVFYTMISFLIFSCLAGEFIFGLGLLADFGFNIMVGVAASFLSALRKN